MIPHKETSCMKAFCYILKTRRVMAMEWDNVYFKHGILLVVIVCWMNKDSCFLIAVFFAVGSG